MSSNDLTLPGAPEADFNHLLRANLERVFNERDPARRAAAVADLYVVDPVMYEPTAIVTGRAAICEVAGRLLDQFGLTFAFHADGVAVGHHGLGTLRWHAGPGEEVAVTGTDAAQIVDRRISRLWVLLDPSVR
ncbi:nuclear transport factor 2 family protein [Paracraurococcus ruber]|uniref:SnoaL-like domain-containing protein n=1 Tax=Paracraurococcus ruber TaxID=77675 RepID=A0ABS1D842_9PROT|nr:nuclear transport factor 2 family protein [Paracraurococcus ruber]MBK1662658.1 hypothetical protein [Paracraurococcus ruber]TDG26844.1 nuclear transport factor 2 family protein [Paracraurococcus ruber]